MHNRSHGFVLLEVLAAVAIIATAGLALISAMAATIESINQHRLREQELWDEERLLAAHTLLTARELDLRLGHRELGIYLTNIQRPQPDLYRIAVSRIDAPEIEDLMTIVYRPARTHVQ